MDTDQTTLLLNQIISQNEQLISGVRKDLADIRSEQLGLSREVFSQTVKFTEFEGMLNTAAAGLSAQVLRIVRDDPGMKEQIRTVVRSEAGWIGGIVGAVVACLVSFVGLKYGG